MKVPVSLTTRLSLLFAGSAAIVLLFAGLLFERAANTRFMEHDMEELNGKMALIHDVLANIKSVDAMDSLQTHLHDTMTGHPGIAVSISSAQGNVLFRAGQREVVDHLLKGEEVDKPQPVDWSYKQSHYRIVAERVMLGIPDSQAAMVNIAFDISGDQQFMLEFREFLWFGMFLAAAAMGWLAWIAVRKGLAPLAEVSNLMANISAQRLDRPIPSESVPQELKELVASFNTMLARLDDSFRRLSEFSSDIAHELRTPIQNLMVQTEVTLTTTSDANEYRNNLQSNLEEFARLSRMISNMLFLAKADNSLLALEQEPIDLHDEILGLLDFYEALASSRRITLTLSGSATVNADKILLQRAISNLLSNAIRFTPDAMAITVEISQLNDQLVSIVVANQGQEIGAEHLSKIFNRLYRVDPARQSGSNENVGLGLAITKSIIKMHNGDITVSSDSEWTRFTIFIPT